MLLLWLSLASIVAVAHGFEILVPPGKTKCLTETFDTDTIAHVKARVAAGAIQRPGTNQDFQARMNALNANSQAGGAATITMVVKEVRTDGLVFDSRAIPTGMAGDYAVASIATRPATMAAMDDNDEEYSICFQDVSPVRRPDPGTHVSISVEKQVSPDEQKINSVNEKLSDSQRRLNEALVVAKKLEQEMYSSKMREHRHRDTSESTNSRVAAFSWLSFAVLAGLGVTQMLYLRQFFKSKHLVS